MAEPPVDPTEPTVTGASAGEHPVDAAARGARRGPPIPRRPPRWFTWGVRAALLLPTYNAAAAANGLVTARRAPPEAVLIGAAAASVLRIVIYLWWAAGRPRLDTNQQTQLADDLKREFGPDANRQLRRTLRRGEPIPEELQPWATPLLRTLESGPLIALVGASMGASSILLSTSPPLQATNSVDIAFLVLVVVYGYVMLGLIAMVWRAQRTLRRHGLTPPQAHEDTP